MVHYRGLLLLVVFAVFLSTFCLQPGEARRTDRRRNARVAKEEAPLASIRNQSPQQETNKLDPARVEALRSLYQQLQSGAPFSDLEAALLQRFNDGDDITIVEADTVISRVLYDLYVRGLKWWELTPERQLLLDQYKEENATQPRRIEGWAESLLMRGSSTRRKSQKKIGRGCHINE
jgi:hypothetical protein